MTRKLVLMENPMSPVAMARDILPPEFEMLVARPGSPAFAEAMREAEFLVGFATAALDAEFYAAAPRLRLLQLLSAGYDRCDIAAARDAGVPICTNGGANGNAVAEHTLMLMLAVGRHLLWQHRTVVAGGWRGQSNSQPSLIELRGRTLGIVGYGNIGKQLSVLAEALGMRVIFYDVATRLPLGNASRCATLDELLHWSDVVTVHVPETPATQGMIGAEQIARMKPGAYLINNARGTLVDMDALAAALRGGHLAGAALDVFPEEPKRNGDPFVSPVQGIPNVILTPHIGGSTEEAQSRIGEEVARKLADYSDTGSTLGAVNFPQVELPPRATGARFMHVHHNAPGVLGAINQVFASHGVNIAGQYLQTEGGIGYVVVDAGATHEGEAILAKLRALPHTIRARLLYERG